jgi:hypothetical protein
MTTHKVKSWPHLFEAIRSGEKKHELRKHDRDYRVGDTMVLQEFDPAVGSYSGREVEAVITYITSAKEPCALSDAGLVQGFCILSIRSPQPIQEGLGI